MVTPMEDKTRFMMLDCLRGLGIVLMIIFHFTYDLHFLRIIDVPFISHFLWQNFARFIASLFLVCAGMGLALVHKKGIKWGHLQKRFLRIGAWALVITAATYYYMPKNFIFFGILHCIAVSSILGVFFVKRPGICLLLSLLLVIPNMIFQPTFIPIVKWFGVVSADYIPLYPWFGLVLLGIYFESIHIHRLPLKRNRFTKSFQFLGKHSLKIYLLHQPILFGILNTLLYFNRSQV